MKIVKDPKMVAMLRARMRIHIETSASDAPIKPITPFGVRDLSNLKEGIFNDTIGLLDLERGEILLAKGTTDPSPYYIEHKPMNLDGTAIMLSQFQEDIWVVGKHGKTKYTALVNRRWKGCKKQVVRRLNRKYQDVGVFAGWYACNLHHAWDADTIGPHSAGCQVVQSQEDYWEIMNRVLNSSMYTKNRGVLFSYHPFMVGDLPGNLTL